MRVCACLCVYFFVYLDLYVCIYVFCSIYGQNEIFPKILWHGYKMCSWWVSKFPEPSITFILISSPIEYLSICFRINFSIRVPKTIPKKCSVFALFGHWSNIIHFLRQQQSMAKTKPLLCFMRKIFTHKWVIKLYCVCQNAGSLWIVICILVVMRHTHTHTNYTRIRTRKHPLAWAATPHMHNNGKAIELMWKISRNLPSLFAISSGTNGWAKNQHIPLWNLSKLISYLVWINPHAFNTKIITWNI